MELLRQVVAFAARRLIEIF